MIKQNPAVSVLLAVYNCETYVEQAVSSILNQTFSDFELILIDDGSSDGSPDILRKLAKEDERISLTVRPNKGIPVTANEMIARARGKYLSLMDHDDIKLPSCLEVGVNYLEAHPECVAVGTLSASIDVDGNIFRRRQKLEQKITPITKRTARFDTFPPQIPSITNPSALIRSDAMKLAGNYRPNLVYAHDFDLWFRLSEVGEIHQINQELLHYRVHGNNTTVLKRPEIIRYEIIVVLSAWCRLNGIDDTFIIGSFSGGSTFGPTIGAYKEVIGNKFPVDTYILHKAIGAGISAIADEVDLASLRKKIIRHSLSWPISSAKMHLLRRTISRSLKGVLKSSA
jgi:glycosyltransferase involved in cell wall biosynthesis